MCYDISFSSSIELITDYLPGLVADPSMKIDFDTTEHVLAQAFRRYPVIIREDGQYKLKAFEWGVIADYMNTPEKVKKGRALMCNAQSEKILHDNRSYWKRIRHQRCLVPVTGFFEHREIRGWKNKVPYFVTRKGRRVFCLPGLYSYSPLPDVETGEMKGTFTVVTRAANSLMRQIHNGGSNAFRMPLFLKDREMELEWLNENLGDEAMAAMLEYELPSEELDYWPVASIRTTKQRGDGRRKTDPYDWPGLPPLGNDEPMKQESLF